MAFRFTLQSVLRFREGVEKNEELALQKIQFELTRVRRQIDELTVALTKANGERNEALQSWMQAFQLKNLQDEMAAGVAAKESLLATLTTLKSQRDAQMQVYQAARVKRRMLSDLEKQKRAEWEQEQARTEQKRLDDIFNARLQRG